MKAFPSPREGIAASALLLLSTTQSSSFYVDDGGGDDETIKEKSESKSSEERLVVSSDCSKSYSSSLTSDDGSSEEVRAHRLRIIAVVARCHEMKLKVVRKRRSKNYRSSDCWKMTSGKPPMMMMTSGSMSETAKGSCLSSSSSGNSSARSRYVTRGGGGEKKDGHGLSSEESKVKRKNVGSAHMRRRAEAILRLLSGGCSSELRIRQLLGDSPDTSKALRMLLKLEEIQRSGAGGRMDPYIYTIAE